MTKKTKDVERVKPPKQEYERINVESDKTSAARNAYRAVARTKNGQLMLRDMMMNLGYKAPSVVASTATACIDPISTVYNEARRDVWLNIRSAIPPEYLNIIEKEEEDSDE